MPKSTSKEFEIDQWMSTGMTEEEAVEESTFWDEVEDLQKMGML